MAPVLMDRRAFGQRLRALRVRQALTQRELGARARLSSDFISRLENGGCSPTLDTLTKLAKGLHVSKAALVSDDYDETDDLARSIRELPELERELALKLLGTLRAHAGRAPSS